ncbi:acid protease [Wolfiporia cocos MD-104 SS10]|uniref:Acid protease n=1 Tax=Wolfiporia cocos (strain MD-104) TaxID=742152 RepID=A0A2H3JNM3_WOLCO|nr:acid protease [Wolfiporia cocos MD-104 SS10]
MFGVAGLSDSSDIKYFTNVSLGGESFQVLIDTGSSDLWVAGNVPNAQSTGKSAGVDYAIGAASGSVMTATMGFDDYTVNNQAFISVPVDSAHPMGQGIIGLGPNSGSDVYQQFNSPAGDSPLNSIFRQNTSTPNFITILLGRDEDDAHPFPGDLTVGEVLPDYENITSQPKLTVAQDADSGAQHWQALVDKDGVIGPDGQPIEVQSVVEGLDQLVAVFDSGFTLPQVPAAVAGAIYSRVPGANFTYSPAAGNVWTIPCNVELNVTFKFGGVSFPVNPLDTSLSPSVLTVMNAAGETVCVGAFQPITTAASPNYDMILGMAFLRNAYLLVNMGDFVDGSSSTAPPYVQLLPLTSAAEAHTQFVDERLGGVDNTSAFHLLPASKANYSAGSTTASGESLQQKIKPYLPYIIAGSATVAILLIVAVSYCVTNSRRKSYQRLHDPAPVGLHHEQPPFPRYSRPHRRY